MIAMDTVGIKGSRNGYLVSIRETCDFREGLEGLRHKIEEKPQLFKGSPVSLDLGWRELREEEFHDLMALIAEFNLKMLGVISSSLSTRQMLEARGIKVIIGRLGLAQHQGRQQKLAEAGVRPAAEEKPVLAEPVQPVVEAPITEEAPTPVASTPVASTPVASTPAPPSAAVPLLGEAAIVLRKTLRSGQRVDFDGNVVVMGDVNAGAHVEAAGDVVVMGSLRGTVHAGSRGRSSASIYALSMHQAMVRIAGVTGEAPSKVARHAACTQVRLEGSHLVFIALKQA